MKIYFDFWLKSTFVFWLCTVHTQVIIDIIILDLFYSILIFTIYKNQRNMMEVSQLTPQQLSKILYLYELYVFIGMLRDIL